MNFQDIRIIYKKEVYGNDAFSQTLNLLSKLEDRVIETCGWRFKYNGELHGKVIIGTRSKPITDDGVITLIKHMVRYMEKLRKSKENLRRKS